MSTSLTGKVAVHASTKPEDTGKTVYAVWAGAGDDINQADPKDSIGAGDLLTFAMVPGTPITTKDIKFDPRHGRVWIHEAYLKFEGGGLSDYLSADVMAPATTLQQTINLDCNIDSDGWVVYVGAGSGTHGLAGTPVLVPRTHSQDGDWDYDGINLVPNISQTGQYKMTAIERSVHRYFNRIPCYGSNATYFSMTSEETSELPVSSGYFIRVNVYNNSNTTWTLSVLTELYRECTVVP